MTATLTKTFATEIDRNAVEAARVISARMTPEQRAAAFEARLRGASRAAFVHGRVF